MHRRRAGEELTHLPRTKRGRKTASSSSAHALQHVNVRNAEPCVRAWTYPMPRWSAVYRDARREVRDRSSESVFIQTPAVDPPARHERVTGDPPCHGGCHYPSDELGT